MIALRRQVRACVRRIAALIAVMIILAGAAPEPFTCGFPFGSSLRVSMGPALALADPVPYEVIAVRMQRPNDTDNIRFQETWNPTMQPESSLVLIQPSGAVEKLVDCDGKRCAAVDPVMSFDGHSVYYSFYYDIVTRNNGRELPFLGADIYRMDLDTRQTFRLTDWEHEWTPNTRLDWASHPLDQSDDKKLSLVHGIFNLGPCVVPGALPGSERIVFVSNRDTFISTSTNTNPNMLLYAMDSDGSNVTPIGRMSMGSALHPTVLRDGRVMFSSAESDSLRSGTMWGLWSVYPDGRHFEPLMSSFKWGASFHFQTQLTNGDIAVAEYYNLNNQGFGTILAFRTAQMAGLPPFGSANPRDPSNPLVRAGYLGNPDNPTQDPMRPSYRTYPFSPPGLRALTGFTIGEDEPAPRLPSGPRSGKATHPSAAPNNDLIVSYSPGAANNNSPPAVAVPRIWSGIFLLPGSTPIDDPSRLVEIKREVGYSYVQGIAVVPYRAIHGVDRPEYIPHLPDGNTAYGYIGTASFYNRDTSPGEGDPLYDGLDSFNDSGGGSTNWHVQGADAGKYTNDDIWAVRVLGMDADRRVYSGHAFRAWGREKLRILGEIPLRKPGSPPDGDGNPDTSFLARIPADVPFTFQTLDRDGMVLNMAQTWHQIRPGEWRTDCGGCHAHAHLPSDFMKTAAARPEYRPWDLVDRAVMLTGDGSGNLGTVSYTGAERREEMTIEYRRHIKPILQAKCVSCHSAQSPGGPAAGLDLGDTTLVNGIEKTFLCLTDDNAAKCGYKPMTGDWRATNASRWVRAFQSRRSLLVWKILGRRTDGWRNEDHPTESVPGDPTTLPPGVNPRLADLDYTGQRMPPPGSPQLTDKEIRTIIRWIDTGAASDFSDDRIRHNGGILEDDSPPTLNVFAPRGGWIPRLDAIEFVATDYLSGLDRTRFSVVADFPVNGMPPGTELFPFFQEQSGERWRLPLTETITNLPGGNIRVRVYDNAGTGGHQGNMIEQKVKFTVDPTAPPPPEPRPPRQPGPGGPNPGGPDASGNFAPVISLRTSSLIVSVKQARRMKIAGTVVDDGLPVQRGKRNKIKRGKVTLTPQIVSAPAGGAVKAPRASRFSNNKKPARFSMKFRLSAPGDYTIRFVASDGARSSSADVVVSVTSTP